MALSRSKIAAALARAGRRDSAAKARQIQGILRAPQLRQPPAVQDACATIASGQIRLITALNAQIAELGEVVAAHFGRHRDADIYASQPGLGVILSARVLAEFGDDPHRVRRRQSTQELRRHLADHPSLRHQKDRPRPLRPQPAPRRRPPAMGLLLNARLTRRQGLLSGPARTRDRPPGRPPPARQPPRRNPARLPQDPHPLRRNHRLAPPHLGSRLTSQNMGCLPRPARADSRVSGFARRRGPDAQRRPVIAHAVALMVAGGDSLTRQRSRSAARCSPSRAATWAPARPTPSVNGSHQSSNVAW